MKPVFRENWKVGFEDACDDMMERVHEALVGVNRVEFGHSGYDGMADLCDHDHEMYIFNGDVILKASVVFGLPFANGWICPPPRAA